MANQSGNTSAISDQVKINPSQIGNDVVNSIDARVLHTFLEGGQHYADWIKNRIEKYGFIEGLDYITNRNSMFSPPRKEYTITLDMAKELSMVERNAKGKEARKYFIQMEKKAKNLPPATEKRPEQLELGYIALGHLKTQLSMSDVSYLGCAKKLHIEIGVSTVMLPEYIENVKATFSATDLLKKNNCSIGVRAFNKLLIQSGFMEIKTRTASKGKIKKYNSITDMGLIYGQNDVSPQNARETQPHWFEDTFMDLFGIVAE